MDKYKKLVSNTLIFAVGTFSSKVLVFLLMPLYTRVLSTEEYGVTNTIVDMGNLLIPLITLGIINAIIRFGLEKNVRKSDVFSTGFFLILLGGVVLVCLQPVLTPVLTPLMNLMEIPSEYVSQNLFLLVAFSFTSAMRSLCHQFVRARGMVRLYAVNGILSTALTILFNVLYLVVFRWGVVGYVLAIITADFLSTCFLFFCADLHKFLRFRGIDFGVSKAMLRYALPLIPNTIFWWIINLSNRFMIAAFLGQSANGLYVAAYKIPNVIILLAGIFSDAWQMSAFTEVQGRNKFFTKVFSTYSSLLFMAASGVILFCRLIIRILVSDAYYECWKYVPILVVTTTFTCMVDFLGSIYMTEKKSLHSMVTTAIGAGANIFLNLQLIPVYGVNGAAMASLGSYFLVFFIRVLDTRRYVRIRFRWLQLCVNFVLVLAQCYIMIQELPLWILWCSLITVAMLLLNMKELVESARKLLRRRTA